MFKIAFMEEALREAREGFRCGSVPVGAVVVRGGCVLAVAHNDGVLGDSYKERADSCKPAAVSPSDRVWRLAWPRPWLHAELIAAAQACQGLNSKSLEGCDVYVTLEPCCMCAEALRLLRPRRIIFGAYDPTKGGFSFTPNSGWKCKQIIGGVRETECRTLLQAYFQQRRAQMRAFRNKLIL